MNVCGKFKEGLWSGSINALKIKYLLKIHFSQTLTLTQISSLIYRMFMSESNVYHQLLISLQIGTGGSEVIKLWTKDTFFSTYFTYNKDSCFWKFSNELSVVVFIDRLPSTKLFLTGISDNFHFYFWFLFQLWF